ncbi:MAG: Kelch repeat-containing protein [Candidatus Bathyarchaeia archaeon]|jgi:N-acetylneuraminic acid mutarotase
MSKRLLLLSFAIFILTILYLAFATLVLATAHNADDSWVTKTALRQPVSTLNAITINGAIFAISGESTQIYDSAFNSWTIKTKMPIPLEEFGIAAYQNKIYCIGGYINGASPTNITLIYDITADNWTRGSPMPTARGWLDANVIDGKIYVIGGCNATSCIYQTEVYDPLADAWATKTSIPELATAYASAVVNNNIYVFYSNVTQIYDVTTDSWSVGASPTFPVFFGRAAATSGVNAPLRIYVLSDNSSEQLSSATITNQIYDPQTDSWTTGASLPTTRFGFGLALLNDRLYAIGGNTQTYRDFNDLLHGPYSAVFDTVEQYTPFGYDAAGLTVSPAIPQSTPTPTASTVEQANYNLIIAVVVVIAVIGCLIYFYSKRKRKFRKV